MITLTQDKDADLNYWLVMADILGDLTISSVQIDPDSELSGITVTSIGPNTTSITDNNGDTFAAGTVIGIQVDGGTAGEVYEIVARMTLNSGESDDRTLALRIIEK